VRHLLLDHQVGLGSRVLVVGCGHGELVKLFDDLGMDAAGLDESPENVSRAAEHEPRSDFHLVSAPAEQSLEHIGNDEPQDLIIVRHLTTYDGNLFCPSSFLATAKLLQHLRPSGWLTFVVHRDQSRRSEGVAHEAACFAEHLTRFPGMHRVSHFADCEFSTIASDWLHFHRHYGEYMVASLRVPDVALSSSEWQRFAMRGASRSAFCCRWSARATAAQSTSLRRAG
jgi:SAM-dependent methyltransferase